MENPRPLPDVEKLAARTVELMGGREKAIAEMEADYYAMKARWNKDVVAIGRILRAHLHVEHYLTEHLQHENPNLGDLETARLSFAQKVNLLKTDSAAIQMLLPGIRHLNKIRNRLAHNLEENVTDDDAVIFLSQAMFKGLRDEGAKLKEGILSAAPLDVLDDFAEFASAMLHNTASAHSQTLRQAMAEIGVASDGGADT
jgi:hypothetical protein